MPSTEILVPHTQAGPCGLIISCSAAKHTEGSALIANEGPLPMVRQVDRGKASRSVLQKQDDGRDRLLLSHAASILSVVLGSCLVAWSCRSSTSPILSPQDEPIVRSRGAHHVFTAGERVSLIDFFAADVRRARRGEPRLANQPILALTEAETRRRRAQIRDSNSFKHSSTNGVTDVLAQPQRAISLEPDYWRGEDMLYQSALSIERTTLLSSAMDRILVARGMRAMFCPMPHVADTLLTDFLAHAEKEHGGKLERLSSFSLRDRERFLTSKDIFRFAFVRHPFTRASATYHTGVESGNLESKEYRQFMGLVRGAPLSEHERELQRLSTLFYLTFLGRQPSESLDETFQPQVALCNIGSIEYQILGHIESFDADIATVAEMLNINTPEQPMSVALETLESNAGEIAATSKEMFRVAKFRNKATKLYAEDFAKLDYSFVE